MKISKKTLYFSELRSFFVFPNSADPDTSSRLKAGGVADLSPEHYTIRCLILVKNAGIYPSRYDRKNVDWNVKTKITNQRETITVLIKYIGRGANCNGVCIYNFETVPRNYCPIKRFVS